MYDITKTVYGVARDLAKSMDIKMERLINTTLNEKYDISVSTNMNPGTLEWFALGLKYDSLVDNGTLNISEVRHLPTDGNVYIPIPFFAKPVSEELTSLEKDSYGLFKQIVIDGVSYNCPYLKRITERGTIVSIKDVTYKDGKYDVDKFNSINADVLSPKVEVGIDTYSDIMEHVAVKSYVHIELTMDEVNNIMLASDLLYPDMVEADRHTISEVALVSGIDDIPICAQVDYFAKIDKPLYQWNTKDKTLTTLYLGGMMPRVKNRKL